MPKLPKNMVMRGNCYYYRESRNGRVVRVSLGSNRKEANRRLRSLKSGEVISSGTVEDAAERWLEVYVPAARNTAGQALAAQRVRDFLVPHIGYVLLNKLTADDLRVYRRRLEKSHLSLQTVKHVLSDVRCFLNWCEDAGLIDRAPVPRKLLPRLQERPPDRLSEEEVESVVALPEPYGFICRLGLGTGLRWGELVRATSRDIQCSWLIVHHTKSTKVRRVPISPALQEELRYRAGLLLSIKDAGGFARQVRRLSGIAGFHAHQMRHTFACRWLEAGGTKTALQQILGHSSIVTTERYGRLGEDHVQTEAARVFAQLVTEVVTPPLQRTP